MAKEILNEEFQKMQKLAGIQLNERISFEAIERMEGLANTQDLASLQAKLRMLSSDWMQEGFEKEDIIDYLAYLVDNI
jgi:hypothetical protein